MTSLHIDFETRAAVDLKKTGAHAYAEDPDTDVLCAAYAVDDGPVELWLPGEPLPESVVQAVEECWTIYAHNAAFERLIWRHVLTRYGWPLVPDDLWRCTMVMAHAMSLPGSLENAAAALGLKVQKDMKGHAVMMQLCKPREVKADGTIVWWDKVQFAAKYDLLNVYCMNDVEVERQLHKRLVALKASELELWHLDQLINDRGIQVDEKLCVKARQIVKATADRLDKEMSRVTEFRVTACSQVQQLLLFVRDRGVDVSSLNKETITDLLIRDDLPDDVRRALEIRREAAKASVAKIDALMRGKGVDGRARGLLQFHAASTGRWAGRRFQPQNLLRPEDGFDVEQAIEDILEGDPDTVAMLYEQPLSVVGNCIRGMVVAGEGKRLVTADFANIEGRGIAWLAGERWKLDAFRAFDAGTGPDLYKVAAGGIFGVRPQDIGKDMRRQIGKVAELALGYQGGPSAFRMMAKTYGLKIEEQYDVIMGAADAQFIDEAADAWGEYGKRSGIAKRAWIPAEVVKRAWRAKHPRIVQFWNDLEGAAVMAIESPGKIVKCGKVSFRVAGSFLWLCLPSRRVLCYPYPKIVDKETSWGTKKPTICFKGVDTYTRKWGETHTYGGKLAENVTQAIARDVLADAMVRLEMAGYPIVLTVHDEVVAEPENGFGSLDEFEDLMGIVPDWATGLPVAVEGWEGARYRK